MDPQIAAIITAVLGIVAGWAGTAHYYENIKPKRAVETSS